MIGWYILFGAWHEVSHIVVAWLCGVRLFLDDGILTLFYRTVIARSCVLVIGGLDDGSSSGLSFSENTVISQNDKNNNTNYITIVRHAGWISSVLAALLIRRYRRNDGNACQAALVTAVEGISTDLLRMQVLLLVPPPAWLAAMTTTTVTTTLFCGNFGIILLHHAWFSEQSGVQSALDVLETMIRVTMMRGAQSGGVITYRPDSTRKQVRGIRSRVVNKKRSDLSVTLRHKVQHDVFRNNNKCGRGPFPSSWVPTFSGHTRFATSSKATMEGTHPQQWTPPSWRRVYDFSEPRHNGASVAAAQHTSSFLVPRPRLVENNITHNGDFDFYVVKGKTYDLDVIQKWLVAVTKCPMPASVDTCAVAGVVDLLRTQGCFGLSARYAICLGLSTSKMHGDFQDFPPYSYFEQFGLVFEQVLSEMLKCAFLGDIGDKPDARRSFAMRVLTKLEARREILIEPVLRYLSDEEDGASLMAFCEATIDAFFDNDLFMTTKTFLSNAKGSFGLCITSSLDAHRQICLAARGQTVRSECVCAPTRANQTVGDSFAGF
jgi:hypothetical protein